MRVPILLMTGLTITIVMQLVPLPPGLWWQIPGRSELTGLFAILGDDSVWRPISLVPGLTYNSLLATLTSWLIVVAFARMPRNRDAALAGVIIAMTSASCLVGLFQLMGGKDSSFYFYKSDGTISGLLANRNHQATLLAITLPLLRIWAVKASSSARLMRSATAVLLGGVILSMLLLTGSRSGLILAGIGLISAYLIAPQRWGGKGSSDRRNKIIRLGIIALPVVLLALAILAGRDLSIQRIITADYGNEIRLRSLPTTLLLAETYFPFGSGYGTFDAVFRIHEPDALLKPTFFNRAHNDFLELIITGGLLPVMLLLVAIAWAAKAGWGAIRRPWQQDGVLEARAGVVILFVLGVASISDYPVRNPMIAAIATIAVCWIARSTRPIIGRAHSDNEVREPANAQSRG